MAAMSAGQAMPAWRRIVPDLFRLGWPVLIAQLAVMAHGLIDTLMAGRYSTDDLAAVGIGGAIFFSVFGPLMGVQLALTPIAARLYGAGRKGDIGEQVRQAAWLSLMLAVAAILIYRFPGAFIALSRPAPEVELKVREFLAIMAWGVPTAMLFRIFYGYSTAISRPRVVMMLNLAGLALKIPLNWWFIHGGLGMPAMGAAGCALATTVVSWLVCGAAWLWCARQPSYRPYRVFAHWSWPRRHDLWQLVSLGLPIGITFMVDVTAFTFMSLFIARLGAVASASHQIAANLAAMCFMLPLALGNASGVLVAQALGAREFALARRTGLISLAMGVLVACVVAASIALAAQPLAAIYSIDADVQAGAAALLVFVAGYHLFDAVQAITVNVLRAYKRTVVPMLIYGIGLWCVGLAGGYQLGLGSPDLAWLGLAPPMGAQGFWAGAIAGMSLAGLAVAVYFFRVTRPDVVRRVEGEAVCAEAGAG
jgi:MATE family multidrug resistance protein